MYVCMYVMYVCMYVCMCVWMYECMNVWMYECMNVWMYVCMHVCMYVCMYMYVCTYVRMYVCTCVCMYVCMCLYVWMYECTYVRPYVRTYVCNYYVFTYRSAWWPWVCLKLGIYDELKITEWAKWSPNAHPCRETIRENHWVVDTFFATQNWGSTWMGIPVCQWIYHIYILVGGWPTPLKNMKVSLCYYSQHMKKIKMFQTTNQIYIYNLRKENLYDWHH